MQKDILNYQILVYANFHKLSQKIKILYKLIIMKSKNKIKYQIIIKKKI